MNFVLTSDNKLYGCGLNTYGQLGINSTTNTSSLTLVTIPDQKVPIQFSTGSEHTVVLMNDGTVYACGRNNYGQLCKPLTTLSSNVLVQIPLPSGVSAIQVSCGENYTIILMNNGTVYGCGLNDVGQLGNGQTSQEAISLTQLINDTGASIAGVNCGKKHTIVYNSNGVVYGCGSDEYGQLGSISVSSYTSQLTFMWYMDGKIVSQIACGENHTILLLNDGKIYGCGLNDVGQLGNGETSQIVNQITEMSNTSGKNITSISCGKNHTVVYNNDGSVYGCGSNVYGQLGNSSTSSMETSLVQMTSIQSKTIRIVKCNDDSTIAIMSTGLVYTCGLNTSGQLGLGGDITDNKNVLTPIGDTTLLATIKRHINIIFRNNITKTYDGNNIISANDTIAVNNITSYAVYILNSLNNNSGLAINTITGTYDNKDVAINKSIEFENIGISSDSYIYPSHQITNIGRINVKSLSASGSISKQYDGTLDIDTSNVTLTIDGIVDNESVVPTYNILVDSNDPDVGTKPVTISNITLPDNDSFKAANYSLFNTTLNTTLSIVRKILTIDPIRVTDKIYDSTKSIHNLSIDFNGVADSETAKFTSDAAFTDSNVGNNISCRITNLFLTPNGTFKPTNYNITPNYPLTFTGNIIPKDITAVIDVTNKQYDGNTNFNNNISLRFTGVISDQPANSTYTTVVNGDAKVGGKVVNITNITLKDNGTFLARNYNIVNTSLNRNINIIPRVLTLVINGITTKIYDGTTNTISILTTNISNAVTNETPKVSYTANFNNANVGNNKPLIISNITLINNGTFLASNYSINNTLTISGNIVRRSLALVIKSVTPKIYDGNNRANITLNISGYVSGQLPKYTAVANFNNASVGNNKPVTINNIKLSGKNSSNYYVLSKYTTKGTITK